MKSIFSRMSLLLTSALLVLSTNSAAQTWPKNCTLIMLEDSCCDGDICGIKRHYVHSAFNSTYERVDIVHPGCLRGDRVSHYAGAQRTGVISIDYKGALGNYFSNAKEAMMYNAVNQICEPGCTALYRKDIAIDAYTGEPIIVPSSYTPSFLDRLPESTRQRCASLVQPGPTPQPGYR